MNSKHSIRSALVALATLSLLGCCAAGAPAAQTTARVGAAGATLKAGSVTLSVPAGALSDDVLVTLREAEPHHAGRAARVEMEPHGLALQRAAEVSVKIDDTNAKVKMIGVDDSGAEHLQEVEVEDRAHHAFKTSVDQLGDVEVELEEGAACSPACGAAEECDDGVCKPHVEDAAAATCDPICDSGLECDDGVCKAHGGGTPAPGSPPGTPPPPAACDPACASGLECDDGICKPHQGP